MINIVMKGCYINIYNKMKKSWGRVVFLKLIGVKLTKYQVLLNITLKHFLNNSLFTSKRQNYWTVFFFHFEQYSCRDVWCYQIFSVILILIIVQNERLSFSLILFLLFEISDFWKLIFSKCRLKFVYFCLKHILRCV